MNERRDLNDDVVLLDELAAMLDELEPIRPGVFDAIVVAAHRLRRPDFAVADLLSDTSSGELAGVRAAETEHVLTYAGGGATLELVITDDGRIRGQAIPPGVVRANLVTERGDEPLEVDEVGRFTVVVGTRAFRVGIQPADSPPFVTPVIRLPGF